MDKKSISSAQFSAIHLKLTPRSLDWLNGATCGVPHLTIYKDLLFGMAVTDDSTMKRGNVVPLKPLEVEASANSFSERWNMSRKVMTRLFKEMVEQGLVRVDASRLCSVLTMSAVVDCTPHEPSSSNPPSAGNQAGQQSTAQPDPDGGIPEATSAVSAEADRADGAPAPKVAGDPPPQASATVTVKAPSTSSISERQQPSSAGGTLLDGMEELP